MTVARTRIPASRVRPKDGPRFVSRTRRPSVSAAPPQSERAREVARAPARRIPTRGLLAGLGRKKALVVVVAKIERPVKSNSCPPAPTDDWSAPGISMVSGGAAPGERALHACDPPEACKREPCPRPLMLPASIAIVCRLIGRALAAAAVRDGHEPGSTVAEGWHDR